MKLQQNTLRYAQLKDRDVVYYLDRPFKVFKPTYGYEMSRADIHVPVTDAVGRVHLIHFESLQVEVPEEPEPPAKEWRETNYYTDTQTGTLYYVSGSDSIAVNSMSASVHSSTILFNPARYKRLYREV